MVDQRICPPIIATSTTTIGTTVINSTASIITSTLPHIPLNDTWAQNGVTIAGGNGEGSASNQLNWPHGLYVDNDETVFIADYYNHRVVEWKSGAASGQVVIDGNGTLIWPYDVIVDKETDSFITCHPDHRRVMRWSRRNRTNGETLINNIACAGLAMDDQRFLYVSEHVNNEVRRYRMGEANGTVVAGGNGEGDRLNQLRHPVYIFVDRDHSIYVSDRGNHRVMKWVKGAKEGIVVAGGQGQGNALTQLSVPKGVFVDQLGRVYVAESGNHRVTCWSNGAKEGKVIAGGNGSGQQANQLDQPEGLSFDRHGNFYVVDQKNHRVQRFSIEAN